MKKKASNKSEALNVYYLLAKHEAILFFDVIFLGLFGG